MWAHAGHPRRVTLQGQALPLLFKMWPAPQALHCPPPCSPPFWLVRAMCSRKPPRSLGRPCLCAQIPSVLALLMGALAYSRFAISFTASFPKLPVNSKRPETLPARARRGGLTNVLTERMTVLSPRHLGRCGGQKTRPSRVGMGYRRPRTLDFQSVLRVPRAHCQALLPFRHVRTPQLGLVHVLAPA